MRGQQTVRTHSDTSKVLEAMRQPGHPPSLFSPQETKKKKPRHNPQTNVRLRRPGEAGGPWMNLLSAVSSEEFGFPWPPGFCGKAPGHHTEASVNSSAV